MNIQLFQECIIAMDWLNPSVLKWFQFIPDWMPFTNNKNDKMSSK